MSFRWPILASAFLFIIPHSLHAAERWTFCTVDSGGARYISRAWRQDFGSPVSNAGGYIYDPQVYGRVVNKFVDVAKAEYNLQEASGASCYVPVKDLDRDTVVGERNSKFGYSSVGPKSVEEVHWPSST